MTALIARTGRQRQRYSDDKFRLVAGCIPYRLKENVDDLTGNIENRLEVLMISSPDHDDLVFPKGGWENDETVYQAARREAMEEAGVKGILDENQLDVWEFRSKSTQNSCSKGGSCRGYMFALKVTEELESYPGQSNYGRIWLSVEAASRLCRYEWMREALEMFLKRMREAAATVPEVTEQPILLPSCYMNSSTRPINAQGSSSRMLEAAAPVPEVTEQPILPPSCYMNSPTRPLNTQGSSSFTSRPDKEGRSLIVLSG